MIELRFHRELYAGTAVDAALVRLADYATFERAEDGPYFVVRVDATTPGRAKRVARELGNFALGLTIESGAERREVEGGKDR